MCGIAGFWGPGNIKEMLSALSHRGPDGEGTYDGGNVQLGARCLKITDPEGQNQPLCNEDKSICVVLNGEVYNYKEIKKELSHHEFATGADTEVIAHAFEEFGIDCVKKFNGCFAFAIWDGAKLYLGRDRLGQKPFYYYHCNGQFIFASEVKSILTQIKTEPYLTDYFFTFETPFEHETLFKDIYLVPPGSVLTFDGNSVAIKKYWEINPETVTSFNEKKCIKTLRGLIEDSVRLRARAQAPVGLFLSGGIDSSLLAYFAKPRFVFSCNYPLGEAFDELEYAKIVARELHAEHTVIRPSAEDFQRYYKEVIWHLDQPVATASTISAFLLAKTASEKVRIILNGEGADELFSGYVRYLLMGIEERLGDVEELKQYHPLAQFFWNKELFSDHAERYFELTRRGTACSDKPLDTVKQIFNSHRNLLNKMTACDLELTLPPLLMMADRVCSAFGLENRSPFLDYRIVEFAFSLPSELKVKEYQTKYILKKVARGIVPDAIIDRKDKKGLITPIAKWFAGDLHAWSDELVRRFDKRNIPFEQGKSRGNYDRFMYTKISLELWFQTFFG